MNTNIMNMQIFHFNKYDLIKVIKGHKWSCVFPGKNYINTNIMNTQN